VIEIYQIVMKWGLQKRIYGDVWGRTIGKGYCMGKLTNEVQMTNDGEMTKESMR